MKHVLSIATILTLSFLLLQAPADAADQSIGFVRNVTGEAFIHRSDTAIPAVVGAKLQAGDTLSTGPNGSLGVEFQDESSASIGPNSSFVVSNFEFSPSTGKAGFLIRITKGSFVYLSGLIAKMSPESAKFETPTATIGIRGTQFAVNIEQLPSQ